jgi:hypothetical protein
MHKRKIFLVGILAVAMLATVGFIGCTAGQLTALEGVIQNIDTVSGIVTVKMQDGSTLTFNFADVKVKTIIEALGGLSIEVGDIVIIKVDENGEVQEIEGNFSEVDGIIKDLGTSRVVITWENDVEVDITLEITPETVIRIEYGGAVNFTDLQVGQQVEAKYDVTSLKALQIEIEDDETEGEIEGIITAIDTDNHMVTITTQDDGDIVVRVTSDTRIEIEEATAVFADLELGLRAQAEYDESSMDALKIEVAANND